MSDSPQIERLAWLRRSALAGDESAWRTLYDESFEPLERFVVGRCQGDRNAADEVVQQTWLVAVRRLRQFDPRRGTLLNWLCGIANNELRNYQRKTRRQLQQASLDGVDSAMELDGAMSFDRPIVETLATLSDRHAAVLRAKYFDGQSVDEIAGEWNETPKAVESLLTRARQTFRRVYHALGGKADE